MKWELQLRTDDQRTQHRKISNNRLHDWRKISSDQDERRKVVEKIASAWT